MLNRLIFISALILLGGLLFFEKNKSPRAAVANKTLLSSLFIVTALVQPHPIAGFYYLLMAGLFFCLGGDVFLALVGERMFLCGLVSFLLGHVLYAAGFFYLADLNSWSWAGTVVALASSSAVFFWLLPHLGSMLIPVAGYIVVITIMVISAWTVLGDSRLAWPGRVMVFSGALCFYLSDVFVARDRFLKPQIANRLIGLPLYYGGQFLLAFSVGIVK